MKQNKMPPSGYAGHVARRSFIKKAALGAVLAVPAIESLTKSDILVKSALAATTGINLTGNWTGSTHNNTTNSNDPGSLSLIQTGNNVSGTSTGGGVLTGIVSGTTFTFTIVNGGTTTTGSGPVSGNSMSGTWSNTGGNTDTGTYTFTK